MEEKQPLHCVIFETEKHQPQRDQKGFYLCIQNEEESVFLMYRDKMLVLAATQHGSLCYRVPTSREGVVPNLGS